MNEDELAVGHAERSKDLRGVAPPHSRAVVNLDHPSPLHFAQPVDRCLQQNLVICKRRLASLLQLADPVGEVLLGELVLPPLVVQRGRTVHRFDQRRVEVLEMLREGLVVVLFANDNVLGQSFLTGSRLNVRHGLLSAMLRICACRGIRTGRSYF